MFNALIQLKIYNIDDGSGGSYGHQALTGRHPDRTEIYCRYRVIKSSSLVPVLFREVFSQVGDTAHANPT